HALHAAHHARIVHRDLKSPNVFLMKEHQGKPRFVKLLDFGIAKLTDPSTSTSMVKTRLGMVMGSPSYMSPEQAMGQPVDRRTDVYSLGVILFEMATGRLPFDGEDKAKVMAAQVYQAPPRPREVARQVSEGVEAVILRALDKDPKKRFQSMTEMGRALAACLGAPAPRKARLVKRAHPLWTRRPALAGAGIAALLLLAAAGMALLRP